MGKSGLKLTKKKVLDDLEKMVSDGSKNRQFLSQVVYRSFLNAERQRFMSENSSQGKTWEPLNQSYAARKLVKWADAEGGGSKINIASGKLVRALLGQNEFKRVVISENYIFITTGLTYQKYVEDQRTIYKFKKEFINGLKKQWVAMLAKKE